ncbi:Glucanosyltransferase-domain-containing protein [Dendryphion nanum]|uniref:1,3-beta-glucanosyltransferase n=1 Tax=Dendryphion nanum TaxID=256645 RepID=A0A9P9EDJ9_9PLEO|nr:Glucanosyltransferase-domain-containing protein [Dendryphion nanum]
MALKSFFRFVACFCGLYFSATSFVSAIPIVTIKGSKFFTTDGEQFYIKGITYQASTFDGNALTKSAQCEIDAQLIKELGANVIRVYSVDPTLNHDACMSSFEKRGIYLLLDMPTPFASISRNEPKWTTELRNLYAQVIDGFSKYDNLLGFFAGNEVVNDESNTGAAAYVRAVIADMKAYQNLQGHRKVPIGYSAANNANLRKLQQDYFNCGNEKSAADFFSSNVYSWCGTSDFVKSGYETLYREADGYSMPIFLSETGCLSNSSTLNSPFRDFADQRVLLGRDMNDRYSGNIMYEWSLGDNGYGIVSYSQASATGTPRKLGDYSRLKDMWATLTPAGVKSSHYDPTLTRRACPTSAKSWLVDPRATLPTVGLDGFATPTAPRYTSTQIRSTASESATSNTGGGQNEPAGVNSRSSETPAASSTDSKSGLSSAVIAGIVLGVLIGIGLILGVVLLFIHRRKRGKQESLAPGDDLHDPFSDKMPVAASDIPSGCYAELPNPTMQTNELAGQERSAELPVRSTTGGESISLASQAPEQSPDAQIPVPVEDSPYVQAQRKTEMQWLEEEENKLRQRRELLMKQTGRA